MGDLALILSYPPKNHHSLGAKQYDTVTQNYVKELGKVNQSFWTKQHEKQSLLEVLNPSTHSIPYLLALRAHIRLAVKDNKLHEVAFDHASVFFSTFDARQIRYAGESFATVLEWFFEAHRGTTNLAPLSAALLRLDPTAGTFTNFHLQLVRQCLVTGVPSQALPILDKNIYAYPQSIVKSITEELYPEAEDLSNTYINKDSGFPGNVKVEYVLEYYLLGAQIYIGLRNWTRARLFLEYLILSPAQHSVSSVFQVEAYKKWLLLGLLAEGRSWPYPRTYDQSSLKNLQGLGKPYEALVKDFEQRDWKKFQAEAETGAQLFMEDGNLSLVREVGIALHKHRIIDLQKTYAALPVSRVAQHLEGSPDQTLQTLTDLIRAGELSASISPAGNGSGDAVLRFHSSPTITASAAEQEQDLHAQTARIEELIIFIRDADRRLKLTKEYSDHVRRAKRAGQGPDGDMADHMDLTWDAPIPHMLEDGDEDIMDG